jgi:hypothetical protein
MAAVSSNNSFVLDYGDGLITVEMDDWDWYGRFNGFGSNH